MYLENRIQKRLEKYENNSLVGQNREPNILISSKIVLEKNRPAVCNAIHAETGQAKRAQGECLGTGSRRRT